MSGGQPFLGTRKFLQQQSQVESPQRIGNPGHGIATWVGHVAPVVETDHNTRQRLGACHASSVAPEVHLAVVAAYVHESMSSQEDVREAINLWHELQQFRIRDGHGRCTPDLIEHVDLAAKHAQRVV
jgi:hypothetical protein